MRRQCELLSLPRSSLYYAPRDPDPEQAVLMRRIDAQYTKTPCYGVPRMTASLRQAGYKVNPKRVRRLMRTMGLEAIYPKRRTSQPDQAHRVFPYLLRGMAITREDQVWSADITYIRLIRGFVYLMAILDWYSRFVVTWELGLTLEVGFCLTALERALRRQQPDIFNTDQGSQFTSEAFTSRLSGAGVRISMDGRGRVFDNIFVERLWRTVKYEEVYLKDYANYGEARKELGRYFEFYNHKRLHQSLKFATPASVYFNPRRAK